MIGTFFGLLIAVFLFYNQSFTANLSEYKNYFFIAPLLILFINILLHALSFAPLQKSSRQISPHLLNLFNKDRLFQLSNGWLIIFALASLLFTLDLNFFQNNQKFILSIWIILFGFSLDTLYCTIKRLLNYLNPFSVLDMFKNKGIKNIQDEREIDLCDQFDAITETSIKSIESTSPFLTNYALSCIQSLTRIFLESSKSISHRSTDSQTEALGITDKVTYTLSYLFHRIDFIFQKALDQKLETVLSSLVTTMGKITLYAAKCDMTLTVPPLIFLGKFATKSIQNKFPDVGVRASLTLLEVTKEIVSSIDLTFLEIQETFLCLIGQLESIAKESFKEDKNIKIMILNQPFFDITELFKTEKMANHQDTPVILKDLERIIAEFQILETVMRTIPPVTT
jgi:hypothetical protein